MTAFIEGMMLVTFTIWPHEWICVEALVTAFEVVAHAPGQQSRRALWVATVACSRSEANLVRCL